jgi:undecaprenyl diphosphate synthase
MSDTKSSVPKHLGIIPDGNRRWAKDNGLSSLDGHKRGSQVFKDIAKEAFEKGVEYLSMYTFSTENWSRSEEEVTYLMDLFLWLAKSEVKELDKSNIKVLFIGEKERLSAKVLKAMNDAEQRTKNNTGGTIIFCLNYGGQQEIVQAVNSVLEQRTENAPITLEQITDNLYHPEIPPIDLVIRTSGEQRISNFMLWRAAYAELYFFDKHWPAMTPADIDQALNDFAGRNRRFGGDHKKDASA